MNSNPFSTPSASRTASPSDKQTWQPELYEQRAGFVQAGGTPLLELLAPRAAEHILDLGCGPGTLTRAIADAGAHVVGLDSSPSMIETARTKYPDLEFEVGDGEQLPYEARFHAVFSNAALHWMLKARDVARGVHRALRPGGRFVAEFGGHNNVRGVREAVDAAAEELGLALPRPFAPWYFPKLGEYTSLLESVGFDVRFAHCFERPSPMPDKDGQTGVAAWLEIFAQTLLQSIPEPQRAPFLSAVERHARPHLYRDGAWHIDYVRLRVVASVG